MRQLSMGVLVLSCITSGLPSAQAGCPDLSGTYAVPAPDPDKGGCSLSWDVDYTTDPPSRVNPTLDFPFYYGLPYGPIRLRPDLKVVVRQRGCEALDFFAAETDAEPQLTLSLAGGRWSRHGYKFPRYNDHGKPGPYCRAGSWGWDCSWDASSVEKDKKGRLIVSTKLTTFGLEYFVIPIFRVGSLRCPLSPRP